MSCALFGLNSFGARFAEFATLKQSCFTLSLIIFGQLKFECYYSYAAILGTIYYCFYITFVVIVMFNIVSAVITEAFRTIKDYLSLEAQQLNLFPDSVYIKRNFNLLVILKLRFYKKDIKNILESNIFLFFLS